MFHFFAGKWYILINSLIILLLPSTFASLSHFLHLALSRSCSLWFLFKNCLTYVHRSSNFLINLFKLIFNHAINKMVFPNGRIGHRIHIKSFKFRRFHSSWVSILRICSPCVKCCIWVVADFPLLFLIIFLSHHDFLKVFLIFLICLSLFEI
jgi:hypothetical protein